MTKEQFIEQYLDRYEQEHPDERIDYQALTEKADCAWYDSQVDAGEKTEYDLTAEQEKESKKARGSAKAVDAYGRKVKRERKPDDDKRKIIKVLVDALTDAGYPAQIANIEKTIDFGAYSVTLTKHRPAKKE